MAEVTNTNMSPVYKIIALMVVGGVAKALFAPQWRPVSPAIAQGVMSGIDKGISTIDTAAKKSN